MNAQGALDSLLGRLTTILLDEAHLLGRLRGDVEFIKDEMECMNALLLHLTDAQHRDRLIRAWMKQVVGLTRDCEGNVELYIRSVTDAGHHATGLLGYLRRMLRFVRTVPLRHQIATRIQELKVRARDVGDRRLRYGVTVPSAADQDDAIFIDEVQVPDGSQGGEDFRRRILLDIGIWEDEEAYVKKGVDELIQLLSEEAPAQELANSEPQPRVFSMVSGGKLFYDDMDIKDRALADRIARGVYERKMSSFGCTALVDMEDDGYSKDMVQVLREIVQQVAPLLPAEEQDALRTKPEQSTETSRGDDEKQEEDELTKTLVGYLKGKRFLIILQHVYSRERMNRIRSLLLRAAVDCSPGSAILITSYGDNVAESPYKIFRCQSLYQIILKKAIEFIAGSKIKYYESALLKLCQPDVFAMRMLLHLLYVNPRRGITQLKNFIEILRGCRPSNKSVAKQLLRLSYNELPTKYRSCLLYLTIFPEGDRIRRTTVCRRWIAEGLIATRENRAEDEADCCFDALFSWGLILPGEISDAGKIKTCTLHHIVREAITRIARDLNFVDTDLPPNLACHLSIHSRIGLQASHSDHSVEAVDGKGIVSFLPFLAKSSQWQLLKMLDLEGCKGLKKDHLKSICKIVLLKYLSLRNTDVTALPKRIEKLRCLETLDIRQTAVKSLATKSIMLPMLKHLLAGHAKSPSNSSDRFQESFTAVLLPSCVRRMGKLETLSHVEVSHSTNDLIDVGQLLQLRKLGVILHGKKGGIALLFQQIEKLHGCLRSLSIQINQPVSKTEDTSCAEEVVAFASPLKLLQSVKISGITSGLLLWIAELDQLAKITLSETYLGEDYIHILGKLRALRCLRLRRNSYAGSGLRFQEGEFKILKSLVVADDTITNITFDAGAAPKLEMIIWSFAKMEAISGLLCLPKLKKLELNGDCDPDPVRQALGEHPEHPDVNHKPRHQHREDGSVFATSTP